MKNKSFCTKIYGLNFLSISKRKIHIR